MTERVEPWRNAYLACPMELIVGFEAGDAPPEPLIDWLIENHPDATWLAEAVAASRQGVQT